MKYEYETDNLILRVLDENDSKMVLDFYREGDAYFGALEPSRVRGFFTEAYQKYALKYERNAFLSESAARFYLFAKDDDKKIIGTVSLRDIRKEDFCSATLGYKMLPDFTGKGFCTEAVSRICDASMRENRLHRISAYVQTDNQASVRVLEKSGFLREGIVKDYVRLRGKWHDYYLYGRIAAD